MIFFPLDVFKRILLFLFAYLRFCAFAWLRFCAFYAFCAFWCVRNLFVKNEKFKTVLITSFILLLLNKQFLNGKILNEGFWGLQDRIL